MRLTENEQLVIVNTVRALSKRADIYLFGSRIDDSKRGGDIDLLIHSQELTNQQLRQIKWQLMEQLGEQKIDLLLSQALNEPSVRLVLPDAIKL